MPSEAAATSSRVFVAKEESPITMPAFLHALAVAISPSGCARHCIAVGAIPRGIEFREPKIGTDVSMRDMSRRTRGRMRYLSYAWEFSRRVEPESAPSL